MVVCVFDWRWSRKIYEFKDSPIYRATVSEQQKSL